MSEILIDSRISVHKKIRCPRHYLLKPGHSGFVMERIPRLRFLKEADAKIFGVRIWQKKKDRFGRPIQNFGDYYQPEVSASFARETIYQPQHPICAQCRRCKLK